MSRFIVLPFLLVSLLANPVCAQDEIWTEIGIYGFMTAINGDAKVGNTTTNVDISLDDILENLDMGFMVFIEHRRGKWSFIGDLAYLDVTAENMTSRTPITSTTLDVQFEQTLAECFVGYRVFAQDHGNAQFGIDLLGGARYNKLESKLGDQASLLGLTTTASRNPSKDWVDGVVGVRAQYAYDNGWGMSGWADIGEGSDSSSYQLIGNVSYGFQNNIRVIGGYRFYHLEFDGARSAVPYELDLDYSGPVIGFSYRF